MTPEHEQVHENAHLKGFELQPDGNGVSGRQYLLVNDDVRIGLVLPASKQEVLYVNGSADEVLFIHEGSGTLRSQFGSLRFCYLDTWDAMGVYTELVEDPDEMMMALMPWR